MRHCRPTRAARVRLTVLDGRVVHDADPED
jgi:hypothetical protein